MEGRVKGGEVERGNATGEDGKEMLERESKWGQDIREGEWTGVTILGVLSLVVPGVLRCLLPMPNVAETMARPGLKNC